MNALEAVLLARSARTSRASCRGSRRSGAPPSSKSPWIVAKELVHRAAHALGERAVLDVPPRAAGVGAQRLEADVSNSSFVCCVNTLRSAVKRCRPRSNSSFSCARAPSCARRRPGSCRAARAAPPAARRCRATRASSIARTPPASARTSALRRRADDVALGGNQLAATAQPRAPAAGFCASSASSPLTLASSAFCADTANTCAGGIPSMLRASCAPAARSRRRSPRRSCSSSHSPSILFRMTMRPALRRRVLAGEVLVPHFEVGLGHAGVGREDEQHRVRVRQQVERELGLGADRVQARACRG